MTDPMAEEAHNLSLSPYNYVNNNPLRYVDPDGMDWYVHDSTGALHWYNGNYADQNRNAPEGYSHLGDDHYFGKRSYGYLQAAQIAYSAQSGEQLESFDFTSQESEIYANEFGFSMVPTKTFSYSITSNVILSNGLGVQRNIYGAIINESYTYKPSYYAVDQHLLTSRRIGESKWDSFANTRIQISTYTYRTPKLFDFLNPDFIGTVHGIVMAFKNPSITLSKTLDGRKLYSSWSEYPNNGPLSKYHPDRRKTNH